MKSGEERRLLFTTRTPVLIGVSGEKVKSEELNRKLGFLDIRLAEQVMEAFQPLLLYHPKET